MLVQHNALQHYAGKIAHVLRLHIYVPHQIACLRQQRNPTIACWSDNITTEEPKALSCEHFGGTLPHYYISIFPHLHTSTLESQWHHTLSFAQPHFSGSDTC